MNSLKLAVLLAFLGHSTSVQGLTCADENTRRADAAKATADAEKKKWDAALKQAELDLATAST